MILWRRFLQRCHYRLHVANAGGIVLFTARDGLVHSTIRARSVHARRHDVLTAGGKERNTAVHKGCWLLHPPAVPSCFPAGSAHKASTIARTSTGDVQCSSKQVGPELRLRLSFPLITAWPLTSQTCSQASTCRRAYNAWPAMCLAWISASDNIRGTYDGSISYMYMYKHSADLPGQLAQRACHARSAQHYSTPWSNGRGHVSAMLFYAYQIIAILLATDCMQMTAQNDNALRPGQRRDSSDRVGSGLARRGRYYRYYACIPINFGLVASLALLIISTTVFLHVHVT